jgi:hypothetical protein
MPAKRELTMRQLRLMLRLHHSGLGVREIGRRLHVARSTIQDNLKRAQVAGLTWPLPPDLTDEILEQRLFSHAGDQNPPFGAEPSRTGPRLRVSSSGRGLIWLCCGRSTGPPIRAAMAIRDSATCFGNLSNVSHR